MQPISGAVIEMPQNVTVELLHRSTQHDIRVRLFGSMAVNLYEHPFRPPLDRDCGIQPSLKSRHGRMIEGATVERACIDPRQHTSDSLLPIEHQWSLTQKKPVNRRR